MAGHYVSDPAKNVTRLRFEKPAVRHGRTPVQRAILTSRHHAIFIKSAAVGSFWGRRGVDMLWRSPGQRPWARRRSATDHMRAAAEILERVLEFSVEF